MTGRDDEHLSDAEIEAILAAQATDLPPEPHVNAPPVTLATREPGQGRFGRWPVLLVLVFILVTLWQSFR